ncbi:hypothetical protein PAECIP111802_00514 [Paenibacillus allorhizosphaerae]|uniref:Metallo-beta-lactamase domain-containing protein n=1 Tax=Paenibacillus allorhizosphaerae TaxID=2849866 RepID=A0ABM8VB46_9BACL|nr:hypothetical protein PAECIP111802_00514 [Paenibacillus allorhizosphaerae]
MGLALVSVVIALGVWYLTVSSGSWIVDSSLPSDVRSGRQTAASPVNTDDVFDVKKYKDQLTIRYLYMDGKVHSGDAIVIQTPDGKTMMIDAGLPEAGGQVVQHLNRLGIGKIDVAVNTHPHIDHIGGFESVISSKQVAQFYMLNTKNSLWGAYYQNVLKEMNQKNVPLSFLEEGALFALGSDVMVEILSPEKGVLPAAITGRDLQVPVNMNSMVLKVTYKAQSFLFTGDIYKDREVELIAKYGSKLHADLLHAPHHGMTTSNTPQLFRTVAPKVVIMSSNLFSNIRLANDLKQQGMQVYSTAENGTILITSNGKDMQVIPEKSGRSAQTASASGTGNQSDPKVNLTFYYAYSGSSFEIFMESYGKFIQKKYPNFSFTFIQNEKGSTLDDLVKTGTGVDVFITSHPAMMQIKERQLAGDISGMVSSHPFDLERFEPVAINAVKQMGEGGKLPGLPFRLNALTIFYNKDLFDKFGVPYPKEGWVWEEAYDTARRLTKEDNGIQYRGLGGRTTGNLMQLNPYSYPLVDTATHKAVIADVNWKRYLDTIIPFYRMPGYDPTADLLESAAQTGLFQKQKTLAMLIAMNSDYPRAANVPGLQWDAAQLPEFPDRKGIGSQPDVVYFVLSATSKHKEEAFLAMAQMTTDEVQTQLARNGIAPVLKGAAIRDVFGQDNADLKGKDAKAMLPVRYAEPAPYTPYNPKAVSAISSAFNSIVLQQKDTETALKDAEAKANRDIAAQLPAQTKP